MKKATSKDSLVQSLTYTSEDKSAGTNVTSTVTFEYGKAVVELPDISDIPEVTY